MVFRRNGPFDDMSLDEMVLFIFYFTSELSKRLVHRSTGLSSPVKYFTDRSKAVLLK